MRHDKENKIIWEQYNPDNRYESNNYSTFEPESGNDWKDELYGVIRQIVQNAAYSSSARLFWNKFQQPRYLHDTINHIEKSARESSGIRLNNWHNQLYSLASAVIYYIISNKGGDFENTFNELKKIVPDEQSAAQQLSKFRNELMSLGKQQGSA